MVFDKLTDLDKQRILNYIKFNLAPPSADLETLLTPWNNAKSTFLENLFQNELIIKKPIEFTEGYDDIADKIENYISYDSRCQSFRNRILEHYKKHFYDPYDWREPERDIYYFVSNLFGECTLIENKILYHIPDKKTLELPIGDIKYTVQYGMKPMRVITKIAQGLGIGITPDADGVSDLEYYRRKHSQALNTKSLKGDLCLSIHPLDYMTMSDNDSGWTSCMSWMDTGEYKQGTVEMMNSPMVVVGYLSNGNFNFGYCGNEEPYQWNDKKWRCLFIVNDDFIINVKGYPYQNDSLVQAAIKELTKLAGWGEVEPVEYKWFSYDDRKEPFIVNNRRISLWFHTGGAMYNDFGSCPHFIALNPNKADDIYMDIYYSGVSECMTCGNTNDDEVGIANGEDNLRCTRCDPTTKCDWCCDRVYDGELYTTADNYRICEYCWNDNTVVDPLDNCTYMIENTQTLYLSNTGNKDFDTTECNYIDIYDTHTMGPLWEKYFTIAEAHYYYNEKTYEGKYYVYINECKPEGLALFDIHNDKDIKEYLSRAF